MIELDLTDTPLADFETAINFYAGVYEIDPLLLAALIMTESDGNPNAYNESTMATGLGQVIPKEMGPPFGGRPTKQKLLKPNFNIMWTASILAQCIEASKEEGHAEDLEYYALAKYSGWEEPGEEWVTRYTEVYWTRFVAKLKELTDAGIGHKVAHFPGHASIENPPIIEQPVARFGY